MTSNPKGGIPQAIGTSFCKSETGFYTNLKWPESLHCYIHADAEGRACLCLAHCGPGPPGRLQTRDANDADEGGEQGGSSEVRQEP